MDTEFTQINLDFDEEKVVNRTIVRLTTSSFSNKDKNVIYQKELRLLKRKSIGYCHLDDMLWNDMMPININELRDGIYELIPTNFYTDWETGYVEDWDYKLIEFIEDD